MEVLRHFFTKRIDVVQKSLWISWLILRYFVSKYILKIFKAIQHIKTWYNSKCANNSNTKNTPDANCTNTANLKITYGAKCANTPNLNTTYKQVASRADKRQDLGSQKIRKNQENSKIKILSILAKKVLLPQCTIPQEK